jgi:hypothetical protein
MLFTPSSSTVTVTVAALAAVNIIAEHAIREIVLRHFESAEETTRMVVVLFIFSLRVFVSRYQTNQHQGMKTVLVGNSQGINQDLLLVVSVRLLNLNFGARSSAIPKDLNGQC